jgi:hypothetical protein
MEWSREQGAAAAADHLLDVAGCGLLVGDGITATGNAWITGNWFNWQLASGITGMLIATSSWL